MNFVVETGASYRIWGVIQSTFTAASRQLPNDLSVLKRSFPSVICAAYRYVGSSGALQPVRTFSVSSGRTMSDDGSGEEYNGGDVASPPRPAPKKPKNDQRLSVERIYQKKTQLEHILLRQVA